MWFLPECHQARMDYRHSAPEKQTHRPTARAGFKHTTNKQTKLAVSIQHKKRGVPAKAEYFRIQNRVWSRHWTTIPNLQRKHEERVHTSTRPHRSRKRQLSDQPRWTRMYWARRFWAWSGLHLPSTASERRTSQTRKWRLSGWLRLSKRVFKSKKRHVQIASGREEAAPFQWTFSRTNLTDRGSRPSSQITVGK